MADTIIIRKTPMLKKAARVSKRKRKLEPLVSKGKNLSNKKIKCVGQDGKLIQPGFRELSRFVDQLCSNQLCSVYDTEHMAKIGSAVMKFGSNSKQVRQAKEEVTEIHRKAVLDFAGNLYEIYRKKLEELKGDLDLPVCCICLSSTDDFEVRNNFFSRQPNKEEEDADPAMTHFVRLSNLPAGISVKKGLKCTCKTTAICMPCFLQLIRKGPHHDNIRVQCPTCRVIFCFKVGVLLRNGDPLVTINGIKHSAAGQCPFRVPMIDGSDSESSGDEEAEDDEVGVNLVPRHASPRPLTPVYLPPRMYSPRSPDYSSSPPRSPHYSPSSPPRSPPPPPSGIPSTPPPLPRRSQRLHKSTMDLRERGTRLFQAPINLCDPFSSDDFSDDDIICMKPLYHNDDEKIVPENAADRAFIDDGNDDIFVGFKKGDVPPPLTKKEKPEKGDRDTDASVLAKCVTENRAEWIDRKGAPTDIHPLMLNMPSYLTTRAQKEQWRAIVKKAHDELQRN